MIPPSLDDLPLSDDSLEAGEWLSAAWENAEQENAPDPDYEEGDQEFGEQLLTPPDQKFAVWDTGNELVICDAEPGDPICDYCLNSCLLAYRFSEN